MRLAFITSGLLIVTLAIATFACATGSCAEAEGPHNFAQTGSLRHSASVCSDDLRQHAARPIRGHCTLRSLAQFQFVEFRRIEIPTPLLFPTGEAARRPARMILVSSIGSPETDRGPPSS